MIKRKITLCKPHKGTIQNVRQKGVFDQIIVMEGVTTTLYIGQRNTGGYDHNWIKNEKIAILCQMGVPLS